MPDRLHPARRSPGFLSAILLSALLLAGVAQANQLVAFSLKAAEAKLLAGRQITHLGALTRPIGGVRDRDDLIIIGEANGDRPVSLDSLSTVLRSILVHRQAPLLSLDRTPETDLDGMQTVRTEGGVWAKTVGADLLAADLLLKDFALSRKPTNPWGFESYYDLSTRQATETGEIADVRALFWFHSPDDANVLATRDGVFVLRETGFKVMNVVTEVAGDRDAAADYRDTAGDQFAAAMSASLDPLIGAHPELRRLREIFDLVAVASGVAAMDPAPDLSYWLEDFEIASVAMPAKLPLISRTAEIKHAGKTLTLRIDGGVKLQALVRRVRDGDVSALREAVLMSRPEPGALSWTLPVGDWDVADLETLSVAPEVKTRAALALEERIGTTMSRQLGGAHASFPDWSRASVQTTTTTIPRMSFTDHMSGFRDIGGVLFAGDSAPGEAGDVSVSLAGGAFAFALDGEDARLSPESYRRFLAAAWAVYFEDEPPGVSIDPIAPNIDKHFVRYIGKVVNSDIGRVLREADYLAKKWFVGVETPDIDRFPSMDQLMKTHGVSALDSWQRIWFVSEDMTFRADGTGGLMFQNGHTTLRTEYLTGGDRGKPSKASEAFVDLVNARREELNQAYPILAELDDYARMVALARFLKRRGVPLFWYLMANKDLVATEDAKEVVDELAAGSKAFPGLTVSGGVDFSRMPRIVQGSGSADPGGPAPRRAPMPSPRGSAGVAAAGAPAPLPARPAPVVIPGVALTNGSDRFGVAYRTDLALRRGDERPGVEVVRYFDPSARATPGSFDADWHLYTPYRIAPEGAETQAFLNAVIPTRMRLIDPATGREQILVFDDATYIAAGYLPEDPEASQVIGLFLMSDASYRLEDKLGNTFLFTGDGYLSDVALSETYHLRYEHGVEIVDPAAADRFGLEIADDSLVALPTMQAVRGLRLVDDMSGLETAFVLDHDSAILAYRPQDPDQIRYDRVVILSDGSAQVQDTEGRALVFGPGGAFERMLLPPEQRVVRAISVGDQKVRIDYRIGANGQPLISRIGLPEDPSIGVDYAHDRGDRLIDVRRGPSS